MPIRSDTLKEKDAGVLWNSKEAGVTAVESAIGEIRNLDQTVYGCRWGPFLRPL